MEELWKDVFGYEGFYQVSNLGNVRSLNRVVVKNNGIKQLRRGRAMVKTLNEDGYPTVKLSKNGKSSRITVHRLVALAFVANPNKLPEVNHKDFNRENAAADNLEWVSHCENIYYTINAGRHHCNWDLRGDKNPNYRNTTLKEFYKRHPEEKQKLARKGAINGNAKPVMATFLTGEVLEFGFIRECAKYLIDNKICKAKKINAVSDKISEAVKNGTPYYNCHFSRG